MDNNYNQDYGWMYGVGAIILLVGLSYLINKQIHKDDESEDSEEKSNQ